MSVTDKAALLIGFEPKSGKGKGEDSDQEYGDPAETACKAAWKAIKKDDYEGFSEALGNWFDAKSDAKKSDAEKSEQDDEEG